MSGMDGVASRYSGARCVLTKVTKGVDYTLQGQAGIAGWPFTCLGSLC